MAKFTPPIQEDNGILGQVFGQDIAWGAKELPDPNAASGESVTVIVETKHPGRVAITYRRQLMKHRRNSHSAWVAVRADLV